MSDVMVLMNESLRRFEEKSRSLYLVRVQRTKKPHTTSCRHIYGNSASDIREDVHILHQRVQYTVVRLK